MTMTVCYFLMSWFPAGAEVGPETEQFTFLRYRAVGEECEPPSQWDQLMALPCGARLVVERNEEGVPEQWVLLPCRAPGNVA